jgi:hypothetical protein
MIHENDGMGLGRTSPRMHAQQDTDSKEGHLDLDQFVLQLSYRLVFQCGR